MFKNKFYLKFMSMLVLASSHLISGCSQDIKKPEGVELAVNTSSIINTETYPLDVQIPDTIKQNISIKLLNGKTIKLSEYPEGETDATVLQSIDVRFIDVDRDSIPELAASFNYGGNSAIFKDCFFIKRSSNFFEQIYLFDGGTEINLNTLSFNFNASSKNFYSCSACTVASRFDLFPEAKLKLKSNGLYFCETDYDLNHKIEANLFIISRKGIPSIDESGFDDGTRKLYVQNLVLYFFNNNGDLSKTKELFYNAFNGTDKNAIWKEIEEVIREIKKGFKLSSLNIKEKTATDINVCKWCGKTNFKPFYDVYQKSVRIGSCEECDAGVALYSFFCSEKCGFNYLNAPSIIKRQKDQDAQKKADNYENRNTNPYLN